MLSGRYPTLRALATDVAAGTVKFRRPEGAEAAAAQDAARAALGRGFAAIDRRRD
jgi:beta-lysine 5,6-aminomutase alpha subunit